MSWAAVLALAAAAESVRLPVTRDTWVSSAEGEENANLGGAAKLKTKSFQEFSLFDIDPGPLRGRTVRRATLYLNAQSADPQRRVTVSSLAAEWVEGTAESYRTEPGAASFLWAEQDRRPWAHPGSDITAVMAGVGHTVWGFAEATPPDDKGWQRVAVEPRVVAARVAGISHGFVLFDDVGSEWERDGEAFRYRQFPNRFVASRHAGAQRAPYLMVETGDADGEPPEAVAALVPGTGPLPPGEAEVTWTTPRDRGPAGVLGFDVRYATNGPFAWEQATVVPRYRVPMAAAAGAPVVLGLGDLGVPPGATLTLGVRPVDAAGNVGPVTMGTVRTAPAPAPLPLALPPPLPTSPDDNRADLPAVHGVTVFAVDLLDKVHPVSGAFVPPRPEAYCHANHLWSAAARRVTLAGGRNEFVSFQVVCRGPAVPVTAEVAFAEGRLRPRLLRFRHVATPAGPLPDPLLPAVAGQPLWPVPGDLDIPAATCRAAVVEVYVPHDLPPGDYPGDLRLTVGGDRLAISLALHVWNVTLPDGLSFVPEMNCYGLPDPPLEAAYYRLAHEHRTCLNRLPYGWNGGVAGGCAPRWSEAGVDWGEYDRRFGPLLDGSAFGDLPRAGVPVDVFYLPLNENWPVPIEHGYTGGYWADTALRPEYRTAFVAATRRVAEHIRERGWNGTLFEFYLNGKVYYKDPRWSRCSAPWVFDEPMHTQDFWALRWYGLAFHEGVGATADGPSLAFRCDISRPQWQRDLLDEVLDVNVVGGTFRRYDRLVRERQERCRQVVLNYGSTNPVPASNLQPVAWCLETWCRGGDGVLPWQTVGTADSWKKADELSLFYPGAEAGQPGPVPSVRLKAYRDGQQLVEYLGLLAHVLAVPRWQVAEWVRTAVPVEARVVQQGEEAGRVDYDRLTPLDLWRLRLAVGAYLDRRGPAPQRRYQAALRTAGRDVRTVAERAPVPSAP